MKISITYKGVDFDVEYDYTPAEETVMYYPDGSGHPGCDESIECIHKFEHQGTCFLEFIEDCEEEIDKLILEKMRE